MDPQVRAYKEAELAQLLDELERLDRLDRLSTYRPTPKQAEFHAAGSEVRFRMLSAGNQSGKTYSAGMEVAMHMTGRYPDWWEGKVFEEPTLWWVGGITGESTRDNPQRILLGAKREWGTGTVPKDALHGDPTMKRGVPDAVDSFQVRWGGGGDIQRISTCWFKSYDQDRTKWQGVTIHGIWMDEEPPFDIYDEAVPRLNYHRGIMLITFTPLLGMTQVCKLFFEPSEDDAYKHERRLILMDLNDATFYSEEQRRDIEASYPEHMRRARARGLPAIGEGLIYPILDEDVMCEPFEIPDFYRRIVGLDFGIDHPTAACFLAWNPDTDTIYIYDTYKQVDANVVIHARALVERGADQIPVSWPHDGLRRLPQRDGADSTPLKEIYQRHGVKMLPYSARYDPDKGGPQPREPVIADCLERMRSGRLKVFSTCEDWFKEKNQYHRKDGKPVDYMDDLMSAMHYGIMMVRTYSRSTVEMPRQTHALSGYDPLHFQAPNDTRITRPQPEGWRPIA